MGKRILLGEQSRKVCKTLVSDMEGTLQRERKREKTRGVREKEGRAPCRARGVQIFAMSFSNSGVARRENGEKTESGM